MPRLTFHGAARTVTGSRHLLENNNKKILIDCGLFQGGSELRARNYQPFPVSPHEIDSVIITHAHNDHIGYLPCLVRNGFRGLIFATPATIGICRISLPDSARLLEEEATYLAKIGMLEPSLVEPLYTEKDAYACMKLFRPVPYDQFQNLAGGGQWRFLPAGHILGSAFAEIYFENGEKLLMSGDLGRFNTPIIVDPTLIDAAEYLVLESTYGDRLHEQLDPEAVLELILTKAFEEGSVVLVPSFSIGRTQELIYFISKLQEKNRLPRIPIYVDSPMATAATLLYAQHSEDHDAEMKIDLREGHSPLNPQHLQFVRDRNHSKMLNSQSGPMMIIAGSGMCNGGRIIHHLKQRLSNPSTVVLFTGYQASGTLGRQILDGTERVMIHKEQVPVRARVEKLMSLSAHADYAEILQWLSHFKSAPKQVFLVHGEFAPQEALKQKIEQQFEWPVKIPSQGESFLLEGFARGLS